MTLQALAEASGVSTPLLSQVERGRTDPSLATLRKISRALDVPLFDLFTSGDSGSKMRVQKRGEHTRVTLPGSDAGYTRISAGIGQLEVLRGDLQPGESTSETLHSHDAEECVVPIAGSVCIETDENDIVLEVGDSCHFWAKIPHRYVNKSDESVTFINIVTPPSL